MIILDDLIVNLKAVSFIVNGESYCTFHFKNGNKVTCNQPWKEVVDEINRADSEIESVQQR